MSQRISVAIVAIIFIFHLVTFSQSNHLPNPLDKEYFRSPVDYKFKLAGNFCELRETHFHAGIDIKPSGGTKRDMIYSIGDGYISRIKISAGGYGRAIYIDHPATGYTSVYAHLDEFSDHIDFVVKQIQTAQESYEIDFLPSPEVLPLTKGEIIGIMGNTGYSYGKHLHFEIRDTKTEMPINPFHFGISADDNISPSMVSLSIHGLDPNTYKIWERRLPLNTAENNQIHLPTPIEVPAWRAGVALQVHDKVSDSHNKQGIYGLHMYVDDSLYYSYHLDKISFGEAKNIIGFYDYKVRKDHKTTYALCYKYPGTDLGFLDHTGTGLIPVYAGFDRKVRIEVEDFHKNKKTLHFSLIRSPENMVLQQPKDSLLSEINVGDSIIIARQDLDIHFGAKSLFRNIRLDLKVDTIGSTEPRFSIHDEDEPVKTPIPISIKPRNLNNEDISKAIIVRTNEKGYGKTNYGGYWQDGRLYTKMNQFGTYFIEYDTQAPSIVKSVFNTKAGNRSIFKFIVSDNLPTKGALVSEIKIKVWIDGIFTISPYTSKNKTLEIPIAHLLNGHHDLKIEVKDHSGNVANFTADFEVNK